MGMYLEQKDTKVMECQYSDCTNIGIHSCSECGKLVCGKHAHIYAGLGFLRCESCEQTYWQPLNERKVRAGRTAIRGCLLLPVGLALLAIGIAIQAGGLGPPPTIAIALQIIGFF